MEPHLLGFRWTLFLMFVLLFTRFFKLTTCLPSDFDHTQGASVSYTRAELLSYRPTGAGSKPSGYENFPREVKPHKRGKPGGLRRRLRKRRHNTPLPSIVFGNVRSLQNKMDELRANARYLYEYREANLLCFTETWLHPAVPDSAIEITDFELARSDRTASSALGNNSTCSDGLGLNYTIPMFEVCRERPDGNGEIVATIPKIIPRRGYGSCPNSGRARLSGHRQCRFSDCLSNPCKNGWCEETMVGFKCHCSEGYRGSSCEKRTTSTITTTQQTTTTPDLIECLSQPCLHDGICLDGINSYTCQCGDGWEGTNCENDIDECSSQPCGNEGICQDEENGYTCTCEDGWTGTHCETEYFCSPNPCRNGGTCTASPGHTPAYTCQCDLGYDDTDCDVSVQLLIVNPDKTGLWVANMSDFVFSSFIELGGSARIGSIFFDDGASALFWENLATPDWSFIRSQMTFDIVMVKLGMPNRTLLSNTREALYPCLTMDVKKQELYWSSYSAGYRRQTVGGEEALYGIVSDLGKIPGSVNPMQCVIDQQRRYFYAIGVIGNRNLAITRFHLDSRHSEVISSDVVFASIYGLTIDDKGEQLFWTSSRYIIYSFDLRTGLGPFTLLNLESLGMLPCSISFVSGWLVWYDRMQDRVCAAQAKVDAEIKLCRFTSNDGKPNHVSMTYVKYMALRRI